MALHFDLSKTSPNSANLYAAQKLDQWAPTEQDKTAKKIGKKMVISFSHFVVTPVAIAESAGHFGVSAIVGNPLSQGIARLCGEHKNDPDTRYGRLYKATNKGFDDSVTGVARNATGVVTIWFPEKKFQKWALKIEQKVSGKGEWLLVNTVHKINPVTLAVLIVAAKAGDHKTILACSASILGPLISTIGTDRELNHLGVPGIRIRKGTPILKSAGKEPAAATGPEETLTPEETQAVLSNNKKMAKIVKALAKEVPNLGRVPDFEEIRSDPFWNAIRCPITNYPIRFIVGVPDGDGDHVFYEKKALTELLDQNESKIPNWPEGTPVSIESVEELPAMQRKIDKKVTQLILSAATEFDLSMFQKTGRKVSRFFSKSKAGEALSN